MPAQTWNKAQVPVGTDRYNLTPDLKTAIESATLLVPVASQAERDQVTTAAKNLGYGGAADPVAVLRTDTGKIEVAYGSGWNTFTPDAPIRTRTAMVGWDGWVNYTQLGRMVFGHFGVKRTDPTFTRAAWGFANFASGLPASNGDRPPGAINPTHGLVQSNVGESASNAYSFFVDTTGQACLEARWTTRSFTQGYWWGGSFVYMAAA